MQSDALFYTPSLCHCICHTATQIAILIIISKSDWIYLESKYFQCLFACVGLCVHFYIECCVHLNFVLSSLSKIAAINIQSIALPLTKNKTSKRKRWILYFPICAIIFLGICHLFSSSFDTLHCIPNHSYTRWPCVYTIHLLYWHTVVSNTAQNSTTQRILEKANNFWLMFLATVKTNFDLGVWVGFWTTYLFDSATHRHSHTLFITILLAASDNSNTFW